MGASLCPHRLRGPRPPLAEAAQLGAAEGRDAIDPGKGYDASWLQRLPLRTRGREIVDSKGDRFRLRGVNWYGASDVYNVVCGLDKQSLDVICESIAELGFNCVRMPFSNEMLRADVAEGSIDFSKNPQLRGLSALQVLDEVVRALGRRRIAVVLNNHTTYSAWCGGPDRNGMWFSPGTEYTEERWIEDWAMLARRYRLCKHVVGHDLRNEVRFCPWPFRWPGVQCSALSRLLFGHDWLAAAAACAKRVLQENSEALIIVERIIWPMHDVAPYLETLGSMLPELEGHLVLAVHHYAWNGPGRYLAFGHRMSSGIAAWAKMLLRGIGIFSQKNYGDMQREELMAELYRQWAHAVCSEKCPVWVNEFGSMENTEHYDMRWFERFVNCLESLDADFAYWPVNGGSKPGGNEGEHYGLLGPDWRPKPNGDRRVDLMRRHGLLPVASAARKS